MDPFLVGIVVLAAVISLRTSFRRGADDPTWELRWSGLDPGYRDWLAAMTTSPAWMKTLSDPEEIGLARGFARREQRRFANLDLIGAILLAFGLALILGGILPSGALGLGFALYAVAIGLAQEQRKRRIRSRLPRQEEPGTVPVRW